MHPNPNPKPNPNPNPNPHTTYPRYVPTMCTHDMYPRCVPTTCTHDLYPHWKTAAKLSDESSDTASSTDHDVPPYLLRSTKIIPHSFVHFPEQVRLAGSHTFHDTVHTEASHIQVLGTAGVRSRTYHDLNRSSDHMLQFTMDLRLLEEICIQAGVVQHAGTDSNEEEDVSGSSGNDCDPDKPVRVRLPKGTVRLSSPIRTHDNGTTCTHDT